MAVKPIEIEIKATGLGQVKSELKALKSELINATDPAEIERLSKAAGTLSDRLNDVNERIKVFAGGSDFEKVSNGLGLIGNQLASFDFEGAQESAKMLTSTIKSMDPKAVADGFKSFIGTIGELSKAFVQMGLKLLANPLFLLVALIGGVVIAIVMLKDKLAIAQKAFDMLMIPIKLVIQALKDLADWLGLTAFAAEDSADRQVAANNRAAASSKASTDKKIAQMDRQIAADKALGKETLQLELERENIAAQGQKETINRARSTYNTLSELAKNGKSVLTKEQRDQLNESVKIINEGYESLKDIESNKTVLLNTATKERADKQAAANEKASAEQKAANDKAIAAEIARNKAFSDLQTKLYDDINNIQAKSDEEKLKLQEEKEERELKNSVLSKEQQRIVQKQIDAKYDLLEAELQQQKLDKLKEITDAHNAETALLLDTSRTAALAAQEEADLAEIDLITVGETAKQEAKKAVEDKYKLLKREAEVADLEEANAKVLEDAENENLSFEARRTLIEDQNKILLANTALTNDERKKLAEENSEALKEIDKAETEAKAKNLNAIGNLLSNAASVLGESTAAGKAAAVAAATISTYQSAVSAYNSMSGIPVVGPALGAVAAGVAVASGIASVKKILAVKTPKGGGGGTAPSPIGGGASAAPAAPSFNLFGKNNEANTATGSKTVGAANQPTPTFNVVARVSETEITATQGRVAKMNANAEL